MRSLSSSITPIPFNPGKFVTLPTRVLEALASPAALTLNYEFDDGPAKPVCYELRRVGVPKLRRRGFTRVQRPMRNM